MCGGKMYVTFLTIFAFILPEMILVSGEHNMTLMIEEYPELGEKSVKFANGQTGYLSYPNATNVTTVSPAVASSSKMEDNVNFTLYNRDNPEGYGLKDYTDLPENFDKSKKTIFVTHGWMSSGKEDEIFFYFLAKDRTKDVGDYYSGFLNFLIEELQMKPEDFHLIGHSLGAHVSGFAARGVVNERKIGRVTGLDPASPGFAGDKDDRLSKNDSSFVDIIHTCAGFLGTEKFIGHADFFPNGGYPPQPGCSIGTLGTCSHGRSYQLFAESITLDQHFAASECTTTKQLDAELCDGKNKVPMGEPTPKNARGIFHLKTTGEKPFLTSSF